MAPDRHDRWIFLLTLAPLPLGCNEVIYVDAPSEESSGGTTTTTPMPMADTSEGSTSIATTTGVDGTSSSGGETTVATDGTTTGTGSSSSDSTTMSIEPGSSSSESSSTTGELGLCEAWGESRALCYGYGNAAYWEMLCYSYLAYADPACALATELYYGCQAYNGCFADCSTEGNMLEACELGCDMIPLVPAAGTIEARCTSLTAQVFACDMAGYYISGFSQYTDYPPEVMTSFCSGGAYFVFGGVPLEVGDSCGGAYEDLLTCLSGLTCGELENEIFFGALCAAERDAVDCRCNLGV